MSRRDKQKKIAEDTIRILKTGRYANGINESFSIEEEMKALLAGAILYTPSDVDSLWEETKPRELYNTVVSVTSETTLQAAKRMVGASEGKVLALNFASAKNPGGGYLNGSSAQEESIARSSGLVPSLESKMAMYHHNRNGKNALYSDYMIYSPNVPVFKDDEGRTEKSTYPVSFITSPAVNLGAIQQNHPSITFSTVEQTMKNRISKILAVAAHQGYERLLLGAFGCGVFKNDPKDVARYFQEALESEPFKGKFKEVVFAIYDNSRNGDVLNAFKETFKS